MVTLRLRQVTWQRPRGRSPARPRSVWSLEYARTRLPGPAPWDPPGPCRLHRDPALRVGPSGLRVPWANLLSQRG